MWRFVLLIFPLLILFACGEKNLFLEYDGVNLISAKDFSVEGAWRLDYGLTTNFAYMGYASAGTVTEAVADGPASGAAVYRLEIVNLMPNGDFEDDTAADWVLNDTDAIASSSNVSVSGSRLNYQINNNSERFDYDLTSLQDGLTENANYILHFSVLNSTTLTLMIHPGFSPASTYWIMPANLLVTSFPMENLSPEFTITDTTGANYLSVGDFEGEYRSSVANGYLDILRISRVDIQHLLITEIPYNFTSENGLTLIHGTYRFSAYIKNDPDVTPAVKNRFGASSVTIGLSELGTNALAEIVPVKTNFLVYRPTDEGADWSAWTKVSATLNLQPTEPDNPDQAIARLFIFPSDYNAQDVGSILISSPSLTFLPNGE